MRYKPKTHKHVKRISGAGHNANLRRWVGVVGRLRRNWEFKPAEAK